MRWQTTAILAVVLLALGAFYYVYEIRGGPERAKVEAQKGRLWTVDAADVTEVELRRGGEVVTLKREPDGWRLVGPVTARGDRGKVDETLTTLTTARVDREIESAPTRLEAYGLDKAAAVVTLRLKNGRQLGLQLGVKNPTGVWVYAREADKPAVFVVSDTVLRDVTRPLADLRDKTVLAFGQRQVTAFEVVTPEETLAVEQVDGRWRLTRPVPLAADAETVTAFLDKLGSTRIKEFVAESPKSLAPYGLVRPLRVSIHTGRDQDRATASSLARSSSSSATSRPRRSSPMMRQASHGTSLGRPCARRSRRRAPPPPRRCCWRRRPTGAGARPWRTPRSPAAGPSSSSAPTRSTGSRARSPSCVTGRCSRRSSRATSRPCACERAARRSWWSGAARPTGGWSRAGRAPRRARKWRTCSIRSPGSNGTRSPRPAARTPCGTGPTRPRSRSPRCARAAPRSPPCSWADTRATTRT